MGSTVILYVKEMKFLLIHKIKVLKPYNRKSFKSPFCIKNILLGSYYHCHHLLITLSDIPIFHNFTYNDLNKPCFIIETLFNYINELSLPHDNNNVSAEIWFWSDEVFRHTINRCELICNFIITY